MNTVPAIRSSRIVVFLLALLPAASVFAGSQTYAAREGTLFAGTQLVSDSGTPIDPGSEGDLVDQIKSYEPMFESILEEQTVYWDDGTEQLIGFTENAFSLPYIALATETVTWKFQSGTWNIFGTVSVTTAGSTGGVERAPLVVPFVPPPNGGEGGGGGSTPLSDAELLELGLTGVEAAMRENLDPNWSLAGITREQLAADLARLESVLAGGYTPEVPEPSIVFMLAAGVLLLPPLVRGRSRTRMAR